MLHRRLLPLVLVVSACFDDPPGLTIADGSSSGDGPTTFMPTTAPPSSSSTSAPEDTGESGETGEADASNWAPSSGTDSEESSSGSSSGSESSSGDPPYEGPYGDCREGPVDGGEYLCPPSPCVLSPPMHSICSPPCDAGCEPGPGGAATACLDTVAEGAVPPVCVIVCAGEGSPCPDDLECAPTTFTQGGEPVWMCMWP
jgi:hypothetical protein